MSEVIISKDQSGVVKSEENLANSTARPYTAICHCRVTFEPDIRTDPDDAKRAWEYLQPFYLVVDGKNLDDIAANVKRKLEAFSTA